MQVGKLWQENMATADGLLTALERELDCKVLGRGKVECVDLKISGGFDVGLVTVDTEEGPLLVDFMNEYMTAERDGYRLGTFPDLVTFIDLEDRVPVCSAQIHAGQNVAVVCVPKEKLCLGRGMFLPELFEPCEKALDKKIWME